MVETPILGYRHVPFDQEKHKRANIPQEALMREVIIPWAKRVSSRGPILDLAAGQGIETKALNELGINCMAVDESKVLTVNSYAKDRTLRANAFQLPFADGIFSGVLLKDALVCFFPEETGVLLQEVRRVMAEQGSFLVISEAQRTLNVWFKPEDDSNLWRLRVFEDTSDWLEKVSEVRLQMGKVMQVDRAVYPEGLIKQAQPYGFVPRDGMEYGMYHSYSEENRWLNKEPGFVLEFVAR